MLTTFPSVVFLFLLQAIDARYTEVAARVGPVQEVMFEGEQITLDIPEEGIVLDSGWTITPHTYPGVSESLLISLARKNSLTQFVDKTLEKFRKGSRLCGERTKTSTSTTLEITRDKHFIQALAIDLFR